MEHVQAAHFATNTNTGTQCVIDACVVTTEANQGNPHHWGETSPFKFISVYQTGLGKCIEYCAFEHYISATSIQSIEDRFNPSNQFGRFNRFNQFNQFDRFKSSNPLSLCFYTKTTIP